MKTIDDLADTILLIFYRVSFALNALAYSCCQIAPCQRVCFFLIVVWLLCYHYHRNKLIIQIVFEKSRRWFCKKTFWVEKGKLITEGKSFLIFQGCCNAGGGDEIKASQSSGDLPRLSSAIFAPSCEIAFFQRDLWRQWRDISLYCLKMETFTVIKSIRLSHFGASVQKSC